MQRSILCVLAASLLFAGGCSSSHTTTPDAGSSGDAAIIDAGTLDLGPDAGPLPLCTPGVLTVRGTIDGTAIETREEFRRRVWRSPAFTPLRSSFASAEGPEALVLVRPTSNTPVGEWYPANALVVADDELVCGREGTRVRARDGALEFELRTLGALGACTSAPRVDGTISGCTGADPCVVESTIAGQSFESVASNNGYLRSGTTTRLELELDDGRGNIWVRSTGSEVTLGLVYLVSDAGEAHVYCVGSAEIVDHERWSLGDLRDLGTCGTADAVDGSIDVCVMTDED